MPPKKKKGVSVRLFDLQKELGNVEQLPDSSLKQNPDYDGAADAKEPADELPASEWRSLLHARGDVKQRNENTNDAWGDRRGLGKDFRANYSNRDSYQQGSRQYGYDKDGEYENRRSPYRDTKNRDDDYNNKCYVEDADFDDIRNGPREMAMNSMEGREYTDVDFSDIRSSMRESGTSGFNSSKEIDEIDFGDVRTAPRESFVSQNGGQQTFHDEMFADIRNSARDLPINARKESEDVDFSDIRSVMKEMGNTMGERNHYFGDAKGKSIGTDSNRNETDGILDRSGGQTWREVDSRPAHLRFGNRLKKSKQSKELQNPATSDANAPTQSAEEQPEQKAEPKLNGTQNTIEQSENIEHSVTIEDAAAPSEVTDTIVEAASPLTEDMSIQKDTPLEIKATHVEEAFVKVESDVTEQAPAEAQDTAEAIAVKMEASSGDAAATSGGANVEHVVSSEEEAARQTTHESHVASAPENVTTDTTELVVDTSKVEPKGADTDDKAEEASLQAPENTVIENQKRAEAKDENIEALNATPAKPMSRFVPRWKLQLEQETQNKKEDPPSSRFAKKSVKVEPERSWKRPGDRREDLERAFQKAAGIKNAEAETAADAIATSKSDKVAAAEKLKMQAKQKQLQDDQKTWELNQKLYSHDETRMREFSDAIINYFEGECSGDEVLVNFRDAITSGSNGIIPSLIFTSHFILRCTNAASTEEVVEKMTQCRNIFEFLLEKSGVEEHKFYYLREFVSILCAMGLPRLSACTALLEAAWDAMYLLRLIEEKQFIQWYDDDTDDTPGRINALFQVMAWVQWLNTAEEEEVNDAPTADHGSQDVTSVLI